MVLSKKVLQLRICVPPTVSDSARIHGWCMIKNCLDWATFAALVQFPLEELLSGNYWVEVKPRDCHNLMMPRKKFPFGGGFSKHRPRAGGALNYGQGLA